MPYIIIESNTKPKDTKILIQKITKAVSEATDVGVERYMTSFKLADMQLSGTDSPCVGITLNAISSISHENNKKSMIAICETIKELMNIESERIYVVFNEINGKNWGLKGSTRD